MAVAKKSWDWFIDGADEFVVGIILHFQADCWTNSIIYYKNIFQCFALFNRFIE